MAAVASGLGTRFWLSWLILSQLASYVAPQSSKQMGLGEKFRRKSGIFALRSRLRRSGVAIPRARE
eukprot:478535-Amorphochlora_amoeboformis.AAC.1